MEANQTKDAIEIVMSWQGSVLETDLVVRERPRSVFVGNEGAVRFLLPTELLEGRAALLACEGEPGNVRYFVRAPGNAELLASRHGEVLETSIDASGARSVALDADVSAEVRIGDFSFFVRPTAQPEEAPAGPIFEGGATRYIGGVLVAHAVMLAAFFFLPPAASALNLDLMSRDARYISAHLTPPQRIDEIIEMDSGGETSGEAPSDAPAPATSSGGDDPEPRVAGGAGRPNASSVRSPGLVTPTSVANLGTFNVMAAAFEHAGDSAGVWGSEHLTGGAGGPGLFAALAGGGGPGTGGLDMGGTGIGTCRAGEVCGRGTIGVGGFDTHSGDGPGTGIGLRGDRPSRLPETHPGVVETTGGLSREVIRRNIQRHMNEVRFCYESELRSNPSLEGRVSLQFMVDASGRVATSSATGAGMTSVASCVSTAARRWTFPASEGPTGVTYPFVFNAGE
jgi:hypothetical protein